MFIIDNGAVTVQLFEGLVQFVTCVYCQTHHPVKFNSNAYTCINRVCCIFLDLEAFEKTFADFVVQFGLSRKAIRTLYYVETYNHGQKYLGHLCNVTNNSLHYTSVNYLCFTTEV